MRSITSRLGLVRWVPRALAVLALAGAALVVLGQVAGQLFWDERVPRVLAEPLLRLWPTAVQVPGSEVVVAQPHWGDAVNVIDEPGWHDRPVDAQFGSGEGAEVMGRFGYVDFWGPDLARQVAWAVTLVAAPLGAAWVWWMLSRTVGTAVAGAPFTQANARRVGQLGLVVLLGPYLLIAAQQLVLIWMLHGSVYADKVSLLFRWESVPLWPLGAGLAVLVLAVVWQRGVEMRDDVEGLV